MFTHSHRKEWSIQGNKDTQTLTLRTFEFWITICWGGGAISGGKIYSQLYLHAKFNSKITLDHKAPIP